MTARAQDDPRIGAGSGTGRRMRPMLLAGLIVAAGALLFAGANAHLVYVAVNSQPDCVDHLKPGGSGAGAAGFSAAKSAC